MKQGGSALGLALVRIALGVFFVFEGVNKLDWFTSATTLQGRLTGWLEQAGPISAWYLRTVALPGVEAWARLVPLGELAVGIAFLLGVWPRLAAALGFLMVLNIHVASGALFEYRFLTNGYGLPVLGPLLGIAIGGARLPLSLRR